MKILFIYSLDDVQSEITPLRSWESIQLGLSYISSLLKANNYQTQLLVLGSSHVKSSLRLLNDAMANFNPDLVCFSTIQSQYPFIKEIADYIKNRWPDKYLLVGGTYPTLSPDAVITDSFDALCIGEGEYPTLELCQQLESGKSPAGIDNLWIKSADGNIEKNQTREFLPDLDVLPFPDREMWKPWINEQMNDQFSVLLGRGCPFECTYCSNHALRKVATGKYVRMRSVRSIVEEISMLQKNDPHSRMYLEVESIAINKSWMFELCNGLEELNKTLDRKINFGCNFRISPNTIDETIFEALSKANIRQLNVGLESGNPAIRAGILKRHYSNEDFVKVISFARKYGIKVLVYNMVGLPGETLNLHKDTVSVNRVCQPDKHFTQVFYPYQGTELYDICIERGYIKDNLDIQIERKQSILNMPDFPKRQIKKAYYLFNYYVYKGHKPMWKISIMIFLVIIQTNQTFNFMFRRLLQNSLLRKVRAKYMKIYDYNI